MKRKREEALEQAIRSLKRSKQKRELNDLSLALIQSIGKFLCWIDMCALRCSSKPWHKGVRQHKLEGIITAYLRQRGVPEPERVCKSLAGPCVWMAGSFPLAALYGFPPEWQPWDLDLFIDSLTFIQEPPLHADKCLENMGVEQKNTGRGEERTYESGSIESANLYPWILTDPQVLPVNWIKVRGAKVPGRFMDKHTLEGTMDMYVLSWIDWSFDLDICRVAFNGKRLYIGNMEALWHRTTRFDLAGYLQRKEAVFRHEQPRRQIWARLNKYVMRGFSIRVTEANDLHETVWLMPGQVQVPACLQTGTTGQPSAKIVLRMLEQDILRSAHNNRIPDGFLLDANRTNVRLDRPEWESKNGSIVALPNVDSWIEVRDFPGATWKKVKVAQRTRTHLIVHEQWDSSSLTRVPLEHGLNWREVNK